MSNYRTQVFKEKDVLIQRLLSEECYSEIFNYVAVNKLEEIEYLK